MLASYPASMVNQKQADLGIPNRFDLTPSRFSKQWEPKIERASAEVPRQIIVQVGGRYGGMSRCYRNLMEIRHYIADGV
jgi:hypothetical protein